MPEYEKLIAELPEQVRAIIDPAACEVDGVGAWKFPSRWNEADDKAQAIHALYATALEGVMGERGPVDMVLFCPACGLQHIDEPSPEWDNPPHRSHLCLGCGHIWRPADVATNGVAAIKTRGSKDPALSVREEGEKEHVQKMHELASVAESAAAGPSACAAGDAQQKSERGLLSQSERAQIERQIDAASGAYGLLDEAEVRAALGASLVGQSTNAWAKQRGLTAQQVDAFMRGVRPLEPKLAAAIGLRRVVFYERLETSPSSADAALDPDQVQS